MNTVEQMVRIYNNIEDAYEDIKEHIMSGWLIYTCTSDGDKTIVIYERELGIWN